MNGLAALVVSRFHPVMSEPIRIPPPDIGLKRERALRAPGFSCVAGLDEVGRGPLAGPVVSAAVVLDLKRVPAGLADSKALTRRAAGSAVRRDPGHRPCGHRVDLA